MGKMTAIDWDQMLLRRAYGMGVNATARDLGISQSVVSNAFAAFDAVKAADWDKCYQLITAGRQNIELFKWAAEKTGAKLPKSLFDAYDERIAADRARTTKAATPVMPETDTVSTENERVFTLKMLELLAKTNELLEPLMDVVMPKYCGDLKDNVNANCDIICERLKNCEDKLEGIKANTRKRGL